MKMRNVPMRSWAQNDGLESVFQASVFRSSTRSIYSLGLSPLRHCIPSSGGSLAAATGFFTLVDVKVGRGMLRPGSAKPMYLRLAVFLYPAFRNPQTHSYRNATTGSTRDALRAGSQHAAAPTVTNNPAIAPNVNGS
jgi:hypothetical protein